jgi:uncharacterized integral membrane protein
VALKAREAEEGKSSMAVGQALLPGRAEVAGATCRRIALPSQDNARRGSRGTRRLGCGLARLSMRASASRTEDQAMVPTREAERRSADSSSAIFVEGSAPEPHRARRRHGRRDALHLRAGVIVALLGVLIALVVANTGSVRLDWLVGSSHASLVWIIFAAALIGWLLGMATSAHVRRRARRRPAARPARSDEEVAR